MAEFLAGLLEQNAVREFLMYVIGGGGATVLVHWFLNTPAGEALATRVAGWLAIFGVAGPSETTRLLAVIFSAIVATAAYGVAGALAFVPLPPDLMGWINLILALGGIGFTGATVRHGRTSLRVRDRLNA